jgi:hypothetical protein
VGAVFLVPAPVVTVVLPLLDSAAFAGAFLVVTAGLAAVFLVTIFSSAMSLARLFDN